MSEPVTSTVQPKLPDTGQVTSYTSTFGEDADYTINPPAYTVNSNGMVTDQVTGLMWQQTDGGEMTYANAITYCQNLELGGYTDWQLPDPYQLYGLLNHDRNPGAERHRLSNNHRRILVVGQYASK